MQQSLTDALAEELESVKNRFLLSSRQTKQEIIQDICAKLVRSYDDKVVANIRRIIDYFVLQQNVDFEYLKKFLRFNAGMDYQTLLREQKDNFDQRFGTVTSPIIPQYELPETVSLDRFQTSGRYHPSPIASVNAGLEALKKIDVNYPEFVFIDVGSGMGRNLMLASNFMFKRIVGIEHSDYLHSVAKSNIRIFLEKTCKKDIFDLQCIDALEFSYPPENAVFYFWRPFFIDRVAEVFFQKMEAFYRSTSSRIVLLFLGPVYPVIEQSEFFKLQTSFSTPDKFYDEDKFFTITVYAN
jgi:hypothetical protein